MLFDVYKSFLPECYLDTNLVEVLLNKPGSVNHKKGNTTIAMLMKTKLVDAFAVALVDDDKRKLKELDDFALVERLCRPNLRLYKHPSKQHYFIQLSPAIEKWILRESQKGSIDLANYGLPSDVNLMKTMKSITQRADDRFVRLFRDMLQNEYCDEITELKRWLHFFKENNFNSNIELL